MLPYSVCGFPCVCACLFLSRGHPSQTVPSAGNSLVYLSLDQRAAAACPQVSKHPALRTSWEEQEEEKGGAVGFCLHPGINHSLHRQQTSTPFAPLTPSNRRSEVILFSYPLSFATFSLRFNLLIFPKQSLSPPLLIFSPSPHVVTPFAIFLSQTSYTFSSLCHCLVIFPKQSFPLPQSLSFIHSPFSHRLPS